MPERLDELTHALKRARWGLNLRGLLALAFGFFALIRPLQTVAILALLVAFWAVFTGIVGIVYALDLRHIARHWWLLLVGGIISLIFGIAAFTRFPTLSLAFLMVLAAWWFFFNGIMEIVTALQQKRQQWPWGWHMVLGVLSILAAAFALLFPPVTMAVLTFWIGISAIVFGIVQLMEAGTSKTMQRRVETMGDTGPDEAPRAAA
ncbi:MAG: HdeD family acid-resistance protein [Longimicrobiales bacterium]